MRDEGVIYVICHPLLKSRCTRLPGCIGLWSDIYCVGWGVKFYSLIHPPTQLPMSLYKLLTHTRLYNLVLVERHWCSKAKETNNCNSGVEVVLWQRLWFMPSVDSIAQSGLWEGHENLMSRFPPFSVDPLKILWTKCISCWPAKVKVSKKLQKKYCGWKSPFSAWGFNSSLASASILM